MVLSPEDKIVKETLFKEKGWGGSKIVQELPNKNWNKNSVNKLIKKIRETGSAARKAGSGRFDLI